MESSKRRVGSEAQSPKKLCEDWTWVIQMRVRKKSEHRARQRESSVEACPASMDVRVVHHSKGGSS